MARRIYIFIAMAVIASVNADAASVRGIGVASRTGSANVQNQTVNPGASYTYNYMYPYLNNDMRTTLKPADPTSPSTSPINTVVRTEQISAPRRVVPRKTTSAGTTTNANVNTNSARIATSNYANTGNGRRVVPRRSTNPTITTNTQNARDASRTQPVYYSTETTPKVVSSARCFADYTECMNMYCERADTAYNRCYCSARLAQIDAEYQPQIQSLINQIAALQAGGDAIDNEELSEYWTSTVTKYTGDNSWANIEDALNIDWATMDSRVRGQNAFITGHEYCAQYLDSCFYMASNMRDAYRSSIAQDCNAYEQGLQRLKSVAESVVEAYQE